MWLYWMFVIKPNAFNNIFRIPTIQLLIKLKVAAREVLLKKFRERSKQKQRTKLEKEADECHVDLPHVACFPLAEV